MATDTEHVTWRVTLPEDWGTDSTPVGYRAITPRRGGADECPHAADHNAAVQARLDGLPEINEDKPPGAWRHVVLVNTGIEVVPAEVSVHRTRAEATASVAAHQATDEVTIRWSEPITAGKRCSLAEVLA